MLVGILKILRLPVRGQDSSALEIQRGKERSNNVTRASYLLDRIDLTNGAKTHFQSGRSFRYPQAWYLLCGWAISWLLERKLR